MNFSSSELVPWMPSSSLKRVIFRLPLTPFFIDPANSAKQRTRGFRGDDFFLQYKGTRKVDEAGAITDEPICGTAAFRKFTSVDLDTHASPKRNGSHTRSYHFDTDTNTVSVRTVEEGTPTIGQTHTRTATTAKQKDAFNDPPDHTEITLSDSVNLGWLSSQLDRWEAESEEFRNRTGVGIATYSFSGQGATQSESDGFLAIIGGGEVVALGGTFSGTPIGMVGDEGEQWNGSFSTWVNRVVRKNAPVIHRESSSSFLSLTKNVAAGNAIYREGYTEVEVSDPVADVWMDDYGVFGSDTALEGVPMLVTGGYELSRLLSFTGEGGANELTLVSRTGKCYRVTLQTGHYNYDSSTEWVTSETHVLTTHRQTLTATHSFGPANNDAWDIRVARIEVEDPTNGSWELMADSDQGDYPASLIGASVVGDCLLFATIKTRSGLRFGFPSLNDSADSGTRYHKRTFRLHLTPGTYHSAPDGCGGSVSGAADLEYIDAFDPATGIQLPRSVTRWSVMLNGTDWTPEVYADFDQLYFIGSSEVTSTPTKIRREGDFETTGSFLVAFDAPNHHGKILISDWVNESMFFADGLNRTGSIPLVPPASGQSRFFEGHRLSYGS